MATNELHIDLLRCEFCAQHNKLLKFCSACGRARTQVIVAKPFDYYNDKPADYRCRTCRSQRNRTPFCVYCKTEMVYTGIAPEAPVVVLPKKLRPRTQEQEDATWIKIRRARAKKHGKKPSAYVFGKSLSTNFAAPMILRLRAEIERHGRNDPAN